MTRDSGLALAALVVAAFLLSASDAFAEGLLKDQSGSFLGFQRIGSQPDDWGPALGAADRPLVFYRAHRGCRVERFVTDDGEFIVRRACS